MLTSGSESRCWRWPTKPLARTHAPESLHGLTVVMTLNVVEADAVADPAIAAGATVLFPVPDQFYGKRSGRFRDPVGHLWVISTQTEALSIDEMRAGLGAWMKQESGG